MSFRLTLLAGALLAAASPAAAVTILSPGGDYNGLTALYVSDVSAISASQNIQAPGRFVGVPNSTVYGIGGQWVTFDLGDYRVIDGAGADLNVYELGGLGGSPEFDLVRVLVSIDGATYHDISGSQAAALNLAGDEAHIAAASAYRQSYDVGAAVTASGANAFRYIRIQGTQANSQGVPGSFGTSAGFDLDAVGVANFALAEPVPEPATWAMAVIGFGAIGTALRRRPRATAAFA